MVNGDVPLAAKLEPIAAIPPVGVEVAVGEAGQLGKGAEHVLEDDQEDEQEADHEREQQHRDCLGEHESAVQVRCRGFVEAQRGLVQRGDDELFARDGEEEDAAEDGKGLVEDFEPVCRLGAGILEFVAEGWAEEEVGEVGVGQVLRVGDTSQRTRELER